jgi:Caspase domain/Putative ATP-dependent DNA helicase recG C-terminal/NB-ARC domain/Tetratricopeptide repeat
VYGVYRALIICNAEYVGDYEFLPPLKGPHNDHRVLASALTNEHSGMFEDSQIKILLNLTAGEMLLETNAFFGSAQPDDILLFYFSGHGASKIQKLYLCGIDSRHDLLPGTAMLHTSLNEIMMDSSAKAKIVILDCCHSGAFKGQAQPELLGGVGRFVLTATAAAQAADDAERAGQPSPFTALLAEGLTRAAVDEDRDGFVSLEDLYHYVSSAPSRGPKPSRLFDGYGRIAIARRPGVEPSRRSLLRPRPFSAAGDAADGQPAEHSDAGPADVATAFMDRGANSARLSAERVAKFRGTLRADIARDLPVLLSSTEFLDRAGLMSQGRLTIAGALLFSEDPTSSVATAIVQCTRVYGVSISDPKDKTDLRGTIPEQIMQARDFVAGHSRTGEAPSEHSSTTRPYYQYPMIAVREIIANALVHRNYENEHACVHVRLYDDRLEVTNPGSWLFRNLAENEPIPISRLSSDSRPPNFRLASVLTWARLVEGEGSGIPATVEDCQDTDAPEPDVVQRDGLVRVTLYPRRPRNPAAGQVRESAAGEPSQGAQADLRWPLEIGFMPATTNSFQSRADLIDNALHHGLASSATGRRPPLFLLGPDGIGKTQLAVQHARTRLRARELDLLVWATANSRASILETYAHAGTELTGSDPADPEESCEAFLTWLSNTEKRWLIVLDDLADPEDLRGLEPPPSRSGRAVITTRRRSAALGADLVPVRMNVFSPDEAVHYLSAELAAHGRTEPAAALAELAEDMAWLPLALTQAVTYMVDQAVSCSQYHAQWTETRSHPPEAPLPGAMPEETAAAVMVSWTLSTGLANTLAPVGLARPMLELAAMLDPTGIPLAVLTTGPALEYLAGDPAQAADPQAAVDAEAAVRVLARLGLLALDERNVHREVVVHPLIQRATRWATTPRRNSRAAEAAAKALLAAWPVPQLESGPGSGLAPGLPRALRANAECLRSSGGTALWETGAHAVLIRAAHSFGQAGFAAMAAERLADIHLNASAYLGANHPDSLSVEAAAAFWQGETGDAVGATAALEALLDSFLTMLGPNHPDTLAVRLSLARFRGVEHGAAAAAAEFESLLRGFTRSHPADKPDPLMTRRDLAISLGAARNTVTATTEFERLLATRQRTLGAEHPDTLATRGSLALWRGACGDAAGAAYDFEALAEDCRRFLGPAHPDTLAARADLGSWLGGGGDPAAAVAELEALVEDYAALFGRQHPGALAARGRLAFWRGEAGDPAAAAAECAALAADLAAELGPHHPDTLAARSSLARYRNQAGDAAGATAVLEELLPDLIRAQGSEHPVVAVIRNRLTHWRARFPAG